MYCLGDSSLNTRHEHLRINCLMKLRAYIIGLQSDRCRERHMNMPVRLHKHCNALAQLTPRELDVLRQMAQGKANAAIAKALSLSESAVGKHVNSIFAKLGLSHEVQLHRRVAAVLTFLRDSGLATHGDD
jgi:DNA-binding NarL/FixJ family response regulator